MHSSQALAPSQSVATRCLFTPKALPRCVVRRGERLVVRAEDPAEIAKKAEKKLETEKANLEGRLQTMENMVIDGDFEKKEVEKGKAEVQKDIEDLRKLQKELKAALEAEDKGSK